MEISKSEWGQFKRLYEMCQADSGWREAFLASPEKWLELHSMSLEPAQATQAVRTLIFREEKMEHNRYLNAYFRSIQEIHEYYRKKTSLTRFSNLAFRSWYERRCAGNNFQSRVSRHMAGLFFMPFAFELSDGCSVGCPFCCLAAKPLEKVCRFTKEQAQLWEEILKITKETGGEMTDASGCYFATEPLDNPDYEKFLRVYHDVFGCYPQTTTAVSQRNVSRTKAFLQELSDENLKRAAVRFSVTSIEQLKEIHSRFTPEELAYVEVLLNNPESINLYSRSGRSVELSETLTSKGFLDNTSSVCICGFVVNMARRTIMLVAPHRPDSLHPLGMQIFEQRSFGNAREYKEALNEMIAKWMHQDFSDDEPLYIADYINFSCEVPLLTIRGDGISRKLSITAEEDRCLKEMFDNHSSLNQAALTSGMSEFAKGRLRGKIKLLYNAGYIEEYRV